MPNFTVRFAPAQQQQRPRVQAPCTPRGLAVVAHACPMHPGPCSSQLQTQLSRTQPSSFAIRRSCRASAPALRLDSRRLHSKSGARPTPSTTIPQEPSVSALCCSLWPMGRSPAAQRAANAPATRSSWPPWLNRPACLLPACSGLNECGCHKHYIALHTGQRASKQHKRQRGGQPGRDTGLGLCAPGGASCPCNGGRCGAGSPLAPPQQVAPAASGSAGGDQG